jgi:hypothetical protein
MLESYRELKDARRIIVCEEKGSKITFYNEIKEPVVKIHIDDEVITDSEGKRCDYLLLCGEKERAVFIELKGRDLKKAIEQLSATINHGEIEKELLEHKKTAYAVVTYIAYTPKEMQKWAEKFARDHKGSILMVVKTPHECDLFTGKARK